VLFNRVHGVTQELRHIVRRGTTRDRPQSYL
jgi:hypothetical protein